jgi:hypothetical protein
MDACTCVVDPDVLGKWERRDFRASVTPTTFDGSGPLTFKSGFVVWPPAQSTREGEVL